MLTFQRSSRQEDRINASKRMEDFDKIKEIDLEAGEEEAGKAAKRIRWILAFILTGYLVLLFNLIELSPLSESFIYRLLFEVKMAY